MTVLFVAYQIDRRLEYIWKLVYELPERLERSRRLQEADADSGEGESAVRAGQQQE